MNKNADVLIVNGRSRLDQITLNLGHIASSPPVPLLF